MRCRGLCICVSVQRLLQARAAPGPEAKLLQRLQPHGAVSPLPHAGHPLREAPLLLLQPPAGGAVPPDVAIARGPRPCQVAAAPVPDGPRRPGPGIALAGTGRPPPRRILPPPADACAVDSGPALVFIICYLLHF